MSGLESSLTPLLRPPALKALIISLLHDPLRDNGSLGGLDRSTPQSAE